MGKRGCLTWSYCWLAGGMGGRTPRLRRSRVAGRSTQRRRLRALEWDDRLLRDDSLGRHVVLGTCDYWLVVVVGGYGNVWAFHATGLRPFAKAH